MIVGVNKLKLWGQDVIIQAKVKSPHIVFDKLIDEACFYYILEGYSNLFMPTQHINIPKKEGVSLQCGHYIGKFTCKNPEDLAEIIVVKFSREVLQKIYVDDLPHLFQKIKKRKTTYFQQVNNSDMLMEYVKGLLFYINNPQLAIEELLILKIRELFILLANSDDSKKIQTLIENLFCDLDFQFKKVIEQYYYSNLNLEELAHLCRMSLSTFKRKFKKTFGVPPHQFMLGKKLEKSLELIKSTSLPLSEICLRSGFKEYSNFSIAFKKKYGTAPSTFRINS